MDSTPSGPKFNSAKNADAGAQVCFDRECLTPPHKIPSRARVPLGGGGDHGWGARLLEDPRRRVIVLNYDAPPPSELQEASLSMPGLRRRRLIVHRS